MNKNELTLNQLTAILGGVIAGPMGKIALIASLGKASKTSLLDASAVIIQRSEYAVVKIQAMTTSE